MNSHLRPLRSLSAGIPVLSLLVFVACSSSSSGTSHPGGSDDAGSSSSRDASGDAATPGLDAGSGQDSSAADAGGGALPDAGTDDAGATDASDAASAADASSPYATSCSTKGSVCAGTGLVCNSFGFGGGAITGYACTETCTTSDDCTSVAEGALTVACTPFTTGSFCVISCDPNSKTSCPSPLECAADEGQATGLCVTL
jgi:hypothetical protein